MQSATAILYVICILFTEYNIEHERLQTQNTLYLCNLMMTNLYCHRLSVLVCNLTVYIIFVSQNLLQLCRFGL